MGEQPGIAAEGGETITSVSSPAQRADGDPASVVPGPALAVITARIDDDRWDGEIIAGKYRLEKIIGKGGMGVVLSARHIGLDEPVAVKILRPAMMAIDGMVVRFIREARAASKIKSEHVVRVMDVGELDGGVPFMVMEYLDGIDLAAHRRQSGPLGVEEAVQIVVEAADAIGEAHALGIIHRDLKPANLFLTNRRDDRRITKVLDFGISKVEDSDDTTKTGTILGSPKYMSPEQMMSRRDVDGRADIWALGAILYELLTGRPPFLAETTPQICALVLNAEPPKPSTLRADLPPGLEAIVLRCLDKSPSGRFATVADLVRALLPFGAPALRATVRIAPAIVAEPATIRPQPLLAAEASPMPTPMATAMEAPPPQRRFPAPAILGGLALIFAAAAAVVLLGRDATPAATPAASAEPPVAAEPAPAPSIVDAPAASAAPPRPEGAPIEARKPPLVAPSPSIKRPRAPAADPFGGTRN